MGAGGTTCGAFQDELRIVGVTTKVKDGDPVAMVFVLEDIEDLAERRIRTDDELAMSGLLGLRQGVAYLALFLREVAEKPTRLHPVVGECQKDDR